MPPTTIPPTTTPPTTGDPNTPPTTTPNPMTPPTVTLPGYAITNLTAARTAVGGTEPTSMTEQQIISTIQMRATAGDTFEFSDFVGGTADVDITCSNTDKSCSGNIPNVGMLTFSLDGIEDLSLVDGDMNLVGFDSNSQAVMVDRGVTLIQSEAAAGQNDGTHLAFQSYGGWLTNSVFGVELLDVTESATTTNRFTSFSFGNDSGSRPTGASAFQYTGVMVGTDTTTGDIIHGDATVQYFTSSANVLHDITFSGVKNLNNGNDVTFGAVTRLNFQNIPLDNNGSFASTNGNIKGAFYGDNHDEVGGIFSRDNIIGAFGGAKL